MFAARRFILPSLLCLSVACGRMDDPMDPFDPGKIPSAGNCLAGCQRGFKCSVGACTLDPSGLWTLTVTSGKVATKSPAGEAWDALGGAPDPFVCLTIGTSRACTSTIKDSFQPVW